MKLKNKPAPALLQTSYLLNEIKKDTKNLVRLSLKTGQTCCIVFHFLYGRLHTMVGWCRLDFILKKQWWASLHGVITALQIGRYQFCLKR
jgi:hypothetical protein